MSLFYGFGSAAEVATRTLAVGVVIWMFTAIALHFGARLALGGLTDVESI
jgi:hypothetical protein